MLHDISRRQADLGVRLHRLVRYSLPAPAPRAQGAGGAARRAVARTRAADDLILGIGRSAADLCADRRAALCELPVPARARLRRHRRVRGCARAVLPHPPRARPVVVADARAPRSARAGDRRTLPTYAPPDELAV